MKVTIIYLALILALPVLLHAQYGGGNGRGDVMIQLLNSPLTNTENNSNTIPASYSLSQNYPNPFNPTTIISFQLPMSNYVTLKVYDVMGREVQTLVNEILNAGTYTVDWNASQFTSGIYFYKIAAGDFVETKRMLLIK